jgi:hypothetical protein
VHFHYCFGTLKFTSGKAPAGPLTNTRIVHILRSSVPNGRIGLREHTIRNAKSTNRNLRNCAIRKVSLLSRSTSPARPATHAQFYYTRGSQPQYVAMNRWLRKKDGGDELANGKKTKKARKGAEETKPQFNLDAALPKVDDFRTSLIMPGLSTRFSMLREQDDPKSKLGKASDDSVLHPKRQSRLHEFGFMAGGLSDIAEVSSLNGSIRPPFANERTNSFDSSREDDGSGSMMTRSRPGEGNVLFGGRQKIYMVSNHTTKGLGRTLYDDDVNMSAYQKLRVEEKEKLRQMDGGEPYGQQSEPSSPSALSRKRETSSSTNSGTVDARTSTAATSIASQGANSVSVTSPAFPPFSHPAGAPEVARITTKTRRLYDQGLDMHIQEQQSTSMNRLNSIQRTRAPTGRSTPPLPFQARSATNLNDRFNRGPGFRSESPNLLYHPSMSRNNSDASSPILGTPQSPALASPIESDSEDAFALKAALQPHDRGKATAMGAFNKPKESFSESQYAERLKHMHRDLPELPTPKSDKSPPRKPTLRERAEQERRKRAEVDASERQRSESPAEQTSGPSAFSRFQAAANQMRVTGPATPSSPAKSPELPDQQVASPASQQGTTFFTSQNSSDDERETVKSTVERPAETTRRFEKLPVATGPAPSIFEHPALRSRATSVEQDDQSQTPSQDEQQDAVHGLDTPPKFNADIDSPTLGPDSGGLSGLIRQHLRNVSNVSNVSSNYDQLDSALSPPMMPAGLAIQTYNFGLQPGQSRSEDVTPAPSTYSHSNPWDLDDLDNPSRDERGSLSSVSPVDVQKPRPLVTNKTPDATDQGFQWDLTPKRTHERIASNETEADHEAFQRDLAQRQRVIHENLRARAEGRSTSPAPGSSGGLKSALNMLRAKSSRESFATVDRNGEPINKPIRKMGLGASSNNASSTSLAGLLGGDSPRPEMPALRPKPSRVLQQSEQDAHREMESRQRSATDTSRSDRPSGRSSSASLRSSARERSNSGTSTGRSRSRADQYRNDVEQGMVEASRGSATPIPGQVAHPALPLPSERPSLDSQSRARSRSNSRTTAANYFDSKHLQPIQTGTASGNASPRLAPPQSKFSPGIPLSPRPSPGGYSPSVNGHSPHPSPIPSYSANHTPPVSNPTTPNIAAFNPSTMQPRQGMLRKKSIAKSDISEPVFLSTTSSIDLVNLPPGASLKNGAEHVAPPLPPINPMRKRFGFGRAENPNPYDPAIQPGFDAPRTPFAEPVRTNSSDALPGHAAPPKPKLRKASSEGKSLHGNAQGQRAPSPALPSVGLGGRNNSPPRPMNEHPMSQQPMNGAMF